MAVNRIHLGHRYFVGTLLLALLVMLLPLPHVLEPFKPYWPALVLFYWILERGDYVHLGMVFTMGLSADLLNGIVLGEQALRLTVLTFITLHFRAQLRFFPIGQQMLAIWALLMSDRVMELGVCIWIGDALPPLTWWAAPLTGVLLWPPLFLLLDRLCHRLQLK